MSATATQHEVAAVPELRAARVPPEGRGLGREEVRLMVSDSTGDRHARFFDLTRFLGAGDLLVVNQSGTRKSAVDAVASPLTVHFSSRIAQRDWVVEFRTDGGRTPHCGPVPTRLSLAGGAELIVREPFNGDRRARLWEARLGGVDDPGSWFARQGRWIRYGYAEKGPVEDAWFQTVFAAETGSAEMPSAGRAFSDGLVEALRAGGVEIASLTLHCGVSSQERGESPYPEQYRVPASTWDRVEEVRLNGGRVVAVGTTVVRALETVARSAPLEGWTDVVIEPDDRVDVVDGIISGFHPPAASHLDLLTAVAGRAVVRRAYRAAGEAGYRSHEFGDAHLLWGNRAASDKRGRHDTMSS